MDDLPEEEVLPICQHNSSPITVNVFLNGKSVVMEVDTGAAVSIMSQCQQRELFSLAALQESTVVLSAYTVERVPVVGSLPVHMEYDGQEEDLSLIVVESNRPALMGRDWLRHLHLNWKMIVYHNNGIAELEKVLQPYAEVFADKLRTVQDTTVSLAMKKSSQPKFFRPCLVPFTIKGAIETEINRLEQAGILEKVETSRWATPIVPMPKKDGTLQLCGDYKVIINPILEVDQHPLPEVIFPSLASGRMFSKLDPRRRTSSCSWTRLPKN